MLFHIDFSAAEFHQIGRPLLSERISMLVRAHRSGRHLVTISRRSSLWLTHENIELIDRDFSCLQSIILEISQNGNLFKQAPIFVNLGLPSTTLMKIGQSTIQLPIDFPDFEQVLTKPVLVLEDLENDGAVVRFVVSKAPSEICPIKPRFEVANGGGSRILDAAKNYINEKRIVFLVADSDRRTPFCAAAIEKRVKRLTRESGWALFFSEIWPCLEIENLFSLSVLETLRSIDSEKCLNQLGIFNKIDLAEEVDINKRYHLFFDLKHGLTKEKVEKISRSESYQWMQERLRKANIDLDADLIPGLGEKLVSQVFKSYAATDEFHKIIRSRDWITVFGSVFQQIMWVFAASKIQLT